MAWDTACPDWSERLLAGRTLVPDLPLFQEEAARALRVFKRLKIPDVIGTPTMGDAAGPWLFPIVEAIFGSYDPATNKRMIQEFFLLIAKKNSKTSSGAAIMLTAQIVNRRPEAELTLIAPTKDVADRSFSQATGAIKLDTELTKLFHVQNHIRTITHRRTGAKLQVKAADTDVITGSKSTFTLIDETHVFADRGNAAEVFVEIRGALAARDDGFLMQITTQSKKPPAGVFKVELSKARDVRDGDLKLPMLPILYELPQELSKDDGWEDPKYWPLINPNLGRSVSLDFLTRELVTAKRSDKSALALFASQHHNVEIGLALQMDRWAGADYWERQADKTLTLEEILNRSEVVTVGIDGGGLDDLLALAVLGRERESRRWLLWNHTWMHESVLELRKSEAQRFKDFEKAGELTIVDDMTDAFEQLADQTAIVEEAQLLDKVGMDPMGVGLIVDALAAVGIEGPDKVVGVAQGWTLNGAIKTAEVKLASGELVHSGQGITAYAVGNAKVEPKGNAITITKQVAGRAKIDPIMAPFNAVALMSKNPEAGGRSVYDTMTDELPGIAGVEDESLSGPVDYEILKDPKHPMFKIMADRWEAQRVEDEF